MKELLPEAFESKQKRREDGEEFGRRFSSNIGKKAKKIESKNTREEDKKYLLLTALGIYTVHRLARDVLHSAIKEGIDFRQSGYFKEKLNSVKSFNWTAKNSPLSALGGMKGVSKAYDLLSEVVGQEKYPYSSEKPLEIYSDENQKSDRS